MPGAYGRLSHIGGRNKKSGLRYLSASFVRKLELALLQSAPVPTDAPASSSSSSSSHPNWNSHSHSNYPTAAARGVALTNAWLTWIPRVRKWSSVLRSTGIKPSQHLSSKPAAKPLSSTTDHSRVPPFNPSESGSGATAHHASHIPLRFITAVFSHILFSRKCRPRRTDLLNLWFSILEHLDRPLHRFPISSWTMQYGRPDCLHCEMNLFVRLLASFAINKAHQPALSDQHKRFHRRMQVMKAIMACMDRVDSARHYYPRRHRHCRPGTDILLRLRRICQGLGLAETGFVGSVLEAAAGIELTKGMRDLRARERRHAALLGSGQSSGEDKNENANEHKHKHKHDGQALGVRLRPRVALKKYFASQVQVMDIFVQHQAMGSLFDALCDSLDQPRTLNDVLVNYSMISRTTSARRAAFMQLASVIDLADPVVSDQIIQLALAGPVTRGLVFQLLRRYNDRVPLDRESTRRQYQDYDKSGRQERLLETANQREHDHDHHHQHHQHYYDLLQTLALIFSTAPHMSAQASWRVTVKIHDLFKQRHQMRKPHFKHETRTQTPAADGGRGEGKHDVQVSVSPMIARALFQAGPFRHLEEDAKIPVTRWRYASEMMGVAEGATARRTLERLARQRLRGSRNGVGRAGDMVVEVDKQEGAA